MKKILIILLLIGNLLANNENFQLKLYEKIFTAIFDKNILKIYADEKSEIILKKSEVFEIVQKCDPANFVIDKKFIKIPKECENKPLFATSYRGFKNTENCFGAFYWRKGRPQIKFRLKTIERFNLNLPKDFMRYAE